MTFGLIEQPLKGFGDPTVFLPLAIGAALFIGFLVYEEIGTEAPMLPLDLFRRRNFAAGNVETFAMYGGLGMLFFFLILFLQQVAGFNALEAGASGLPVTIVMLLLSMRFGMLADRYGPRFFMGVGPLLSAAGLALLLRLDADVNYFIDLLPAMLLFALGLSMTVAPLTATVLSDADEHNAGIASGVNNAIARVAALVAIAAVGAVVAAQFRSELDSNLGPLASRPDLAPALKEAERQPLAKVVPSKTPPPVRARVAKATQDASVHAFRVGIGVSTVLVALGGVLGLVGIRNPRRAVKSEGCPGGQLAGVPEDASRQSPCDWQRARAAEQVS
jgi:hypothetical protein